MTIINSVISSIVAGTQLKGIKLADIITYDILGGLPEDSIFEYRVQTNELWLKAGAEVKEDVYLDLGGETFTLYVTPVTPVTPVLPSPSKNIIKGTSNDDYIKGTEGRDRILGRDGNDTLHGNGGNDNLSGRQGHDYLYGGEGNDRLLGHTGNDYLFGGAGNDFLAGGKGDDHLEGGDGNDRIKGRKGNDDIYGGKGDDRLDGGAGDDVINADFGQDIIDGGEGYDIGIFNYGHASNAVVMAIYSGGPSSWKQNKDGGWSSGSTPKYTYQQIQIDLNDSGQQEVSDEYDYFIGIERLEVTGGSAGDVLFGGDGHDELKGNAGNDNIYGGDGDDDLYGGADRDKLIGGNGDDTLYGQDDNDILKGDDGSDKLDGGAGDDYLVGDDGDDTLKGGSGDDYLVGGEGDDILYDGSGNDTLDGEAGHNVAQFDYSHSQGDIRVSSATGKKWDNSSGDWVEGDLAVGGLAVGGLVKDGGEYFTYQRIWADLNGNGIEDAGDEFDYFKNIEEINIINTNSGTEIIYLKEINAEYGTDGTDYYYGSYGNDTYYGRGGNDYIFGEYADDTLYGDSGNDYIVGEQGDDIIKGGAGNDSLDGGLGNDVIDGGDGYDTVQFHYIHSKGDVKGSATPEKKWGQDADGIWSEGAGEGFVYQRIWADLNGDNIEDSRDEYDYFVNIEKVIINVYQTPYEGKAIYGTQFRDVIYGSMRNDAIQGKNGDDLLLGEEGNDWLDGGMGNDNLSGGDGADEFVLNANAHSGVDIVEDFSVAEGDKILIDASDKSILTIRDNGNHTNITNTAGTEIYMILNNVDSDYSFDTYFDVI